MICALLIFRTPDLPAPLSALSPWLDWLIVPRDEVLARLEAQQHRRFIKTHTPLDGIPLDPRATYIVVARHPLDMAVSLFHQSDNLNRERIAELTGGSRPTSAPQPPPTPARLAAGLDRPGRRTGRRDGLAARRDVAPVRRLAAAAPEQRLLVHYADLSADLARRCAASPRACTSTCRRRWPDLVDAAGFARMRERADDLAPDPAGILKDRRAFFRRGRSGAGRELLTDAEFAHYLARTATMAPARPAVMAAPLTGLAVYTNRIRGMSLVPSRRVFTARTWLTPIRPCSKASADAAM